MDSAEPPSLGLDSAAPPSLGLDSVAPPILPLVSVLSLLACSVQVLTAALLTRRYGGRSSAEDRWILLWLFYDVIVHLTLEGPFVYMSVFGTVATSEGPLAELWREYGKADSRWLVSDPTIVSIEILTVVLDSLIALLLIHAVLRDKYYRSGRGGSSLSREAQASLSPVTSSSSSGDPKVFPSQLRDIVSPACPGSSLGPSPGGTCPEHLTREASRWRPDQIPALVDLEEDQSLL